MKVERVRRNALSWVVMFDGVDNEADNSGRELVARRCERRVPVARDQGLNGLPGFNQSRRAQSSFVNQFTPVLGRRQVISHSGPG